MLGMERASSSRLSVDNRKPSHVADNQYATFWKWRGQVRADCQLVAANLHMWLKISTRHSEMERASSSRLSIGSSKPSHVADNQYATFWKWRGQVQADCQLVAANLQMWLIISMRHSASTPLVHIRPSCHHCICFMNVGDP
jgi:hypothetical protein